jgi:16S rRNA (cytosine1402-N4)-methyltransferase
MLSETILGLNVQPGGIYVDVTCGGCGHSRAILEAMRREGDEAKGKLYSFDQDLDALENARLLGMDKHENWQFVHSNFRYLRNFMDYYGVKQIDGLLADLGVSFHHFDCPERGFSFRYSAPLDMRMNQTGGKTAADILNTYSEEDLARVLYIYGELKTAKPLAKRIVKVRENSPITRTEDLVSIVLGKKVQELRSSGVQEFRGSGVQELDVPAAAKKDMAKVFQALRIEVNDEMGALREMLLAARDLLKPGGRIAILTYHSLEDRIVKNFLRSGNLEGTIEKDFYGNILTPFKVLEKGLTASEEEVERNPRARSAKLRVAEKL